MDPFCYLMPDLIVYPAIFLYGFLGIHKIKSQNKPLHYFKD